MAGEEIFGLEGEERMLLTMLRGDPGDEIEAVLFIKRLRRGEVRMSKYPFSLGWTVESLDCLYSR